MRILQLLPELNEGGVERGVVELNREFVKRGLESLVISKGGKLVERIEADGGTHHTLNVCDKNLFTAPSRVRQLRRLIRRLQPDIIHARSRLPAWLAWFAHKPLGIPFMTTVHGMNSVNAYSRIMSRGERVICVSEVIRDYITQHYPVDPSRLRVIQRGVDMDLFNPTNTDQSFIEEFRQKYALHNRFVISSVGRITWLKDYETFIKAIAKSANKIPNISALIIGGAREDKADYLQSLKNLAAECGVAERVHFVGNQQRIAEIYQLSDVLVNASLKMGNVGRTVVESLAMNTPVLATTFEGLNNLVKDGRNGFIIETQSAQDLADKIQRLHDDPISETRTTVPAEFTLDTMVEQTLDVYRDLLNEQPQKSNN